MIQTNFDLYKMNINIELILSQVPGYPEWFNIKYENNEKIYTSKLLLDYENGDFEVII